MKPRLHLIFGGLMLVMLLGALDSTILATALPTIVRDLGGIDHLGWVVTAYLLTQTVVTPLYGRLGDLYGRKIVLQAAIVIFLAGSALCGLSGSMLQLILFRAIQGLGGGGLVVTTQAVIGDIVTPRERGRYQGLLGAGFGIASIAGPLLGGFFTTHLSWRWIFYINLPLGAIALALMTSTLPAHERKAGQRVDFAGAGLLAALLAGIVLMTELGGTAYPWRSREMLLTGLSLAAVLAAFIAVERRADTPVLPLHLFADRTFALTSAVGFTVGFALFGAVAYMPMFLQVSHGSSPTASGLQMMPMMIGTLTASVTAGQLISRTGRYKIFPVAGTLLVTTALGLLTLVSADTPASGLVGRLLLLGVGLGLVMQVLVLAVQNAVPYGDLGAATSAAMLFRLVGGSMGTAVLGVLFASEYQAARPAAGDVLAIAGAMQSVFATAAIVAAAGAILTWFIPERPLRDTVAATAGEVGQEAGEAFALPSTPGSAEELSRALSILADRDVRRAYVAGIVSRAGLQLMPVSGWLVIQIGENPAVDVDALGRAHGVPADRIAAGFQELLLHGLVAPAGPTPARFALTDEGCAAFTRLSTARRERLAELTAQWPPQQRQELAAVLRQLAGVLVPETPSSPKR